MLAGVESGRGEERNVEIHSSIEALQPSRDSLYAGGYTVDDERLRRPSVSVRVPATAHGADHGVQAKAAEISSLIPRLAFRST